MTTLNRATTIKQLTVMAKVAKSRGSLPICAGVLLDLDANAMRVTNLDTTITVDLETNTRTDGAGIVDCHILLSTLKTMKGGKDVTLQWTDNGLHVVVGPHVAILPTIAKTEDFPTRPVLEGSAHWIETPTFLRALAATIPCTARDNTRPTLAGILMELNDDNAVLTAVDGYRLASETVPLIRYVGQWVEPPCTERKTAIVPWQACQRFAELMKGETTPTFIRRNVTTVQLSTYNVTLTARTIDGTFPNYQQILPKAKAEDVTASVNPAALLQAVKLATVAAEKVELHVNGAIAVQGFTDGVDCGMAVPVAATTMGTEEYQTRKGKELRVCFEPTYLTDALASLESAYGEPLITIRINSPESAVTLTRPDRDLTAIVMPLRRN